MNSPAGLLPRPAGRKNTGQADLREAQVHGGDRDKMQLVVGLGNPGRRYARTRHNVGFRVLEVLRARWQCPKGRKAFGGLVNDVRLARPDLQPRRVMLLEPRTFMNRCGQAVRDLAAFYKFDYENILVVLDDIALPLGRLRSRAGGSAGGHNGLADVLAALGSDEVPRLRIGIGAPPTGMDAADFVLGKLAPDEERILAGPFNLAAQAVEDWIFNGLTYVMSRYNTMPEGLNTESTNESDTKDL